jgi:ADP-ribose pyrophosphatase YjhB (NUDIX family)
MSHGQVLLVRYRDVSGYDGQRGWFLPDAALERYEPPESAAARILRDQVGLTATATLDHVESLGNGIWHLIFHFRATLDTPRTIVRGANVEVAEWYPLAALPGAADVAHDGWAVEVLNRISHAPSG